ncbi:DUF3083 family protein [Colwellia psychrerythraea]|uniref:DUF3083 family protein n=1 Tax=Colwellia psychrerythraea (strain 34H / ATCC BAA-681) TaxID=167879 RepID=Q47XH7_COLP3|nr:DUF3083 family protein [Colwellia psychrerythraea]AAZ25944.1 hypothetical protein CPS_3831 [Colwellia psychrerythraea 34H]
MRRTSSILKKHRSGERVYVPSDSRDNQYILAEIPLTDNLIDLVCGGIDKTADKPYQKFYQSLSHKVFDIVEEHGLSHVNFVANNRLVRVRYSGEQQVLHTEQQSFFFYCPEHNSTFKGYFDGAVRARKVKILFLATGQELRVNSGKFHFKVSQAIKDISKKIGLAENEIKLRDHQHLTFDVFAKEKGDTNSISHTFREIADRYESQNQSISKDHTSITYVVASIPMARRLLKGADIDYLSDEPFSKLYQKIESAFNNSCNANQINQAAMIANGVSPFVRYDEDETTNVAGELISIGVNPNNAERRFCVHWEADRLVDTLRFVFFADKSDETHHNYGKFVNQAITAVRAFSDEVNWKKESDDIIVRVHQHIMLNV